MRGARNWRRGLRWSKTERGCPQPQQVRTRLRNRVYGHLTSYGLLRLGTAALRLWSWWWTMPDAVYPVRIDPTFSDANWVSMGGIPGADGHVYAAVVDGSGNLYIGGDFTVVGNIYCQLHRPMEREQLVGAGFGDEQQCVCAGGVGQHVVCGRLFHDGGRQRGQLHRAMEREQLVGAGFGDERAYVYALAVSGSTLYAGGDFTTAGGNAANNIAQWNGSSWSALGSGMRRLVCVCAGGVGQHVVCGRQFHDGGRHHGQLHRPMEREQLVGAGFGDERRCVCAGGVGQHVVCGRQFHDGGRQRGQLHRAMEREQLVGAGFGDERTMCMRWRCRAARCMRAAISRRRAATRPITSRNGTGAVGRRSVRGWNSYVYALAVSGSTLYAGGEFTTAGGNAGQ